MAEPLNVGVMGYSGAKFDINRAKYLIATAFDLVAENNPGRQIIIVSGYTNLGIPALAYAESIKRGWKTVGVACARANDADSEVFPCDDVYIVGEEWGDESPTFLNMCHAFIRVGGGKQSLRETAQAKAEGKTVLEYELPILP